MKTQLSLRGVNKMSDAVIQRNKGFTILEMGIVLLVIGLVISGVLVGGEMISTSRQNALISDIRSYETAVNTFELNYGYKPGDMRNATDYWSGSANGNGDGVVNNSEPARFWEQLSLAEIIKGSLAYDAAVIIGTSFPQTSFEGVTVTYGDSNFWGDSGGDFFIKRAGDKSNVFCVQGASTSYGATDICASSTGSIFFVEDALAIDLRIDDGVASLGKVIASTCIPGQFEFEEFGGGSWIGDDFDYDLDSTYPCGLMFIPKNNK